MSSLPAGRPVRRGVALARPALRTGLRAGVPVLVAFALATGALAACSTTATNGTDAGSGAIADVVQVPSPTHSGSRGGLSANEGDASETEPPAGIDSLAENRNAGTDKWLISSEPAGTRIEGYADATSVLSGEGLGLFVSSTAPTFVVDVLRTGSYDGHFARRLWRSPSIKGGVQTATVTDPATRMLSASWSRSTTLDTHGWPPGAYLAKLVGSDGAQSYVPFVVRDRRSTGAVLLVDSVNTWQAYNSWGGANTYRGNVSSDKQVDFEERAVAASFDRPYDREYGAGGFIGGELPAIAAAERIGLRVNYATDVDIELHPEVLDGAVGVAFLGHSEYWSRAMRDVVTAVRDQGTNLAFLGANDVDRRIRFQPSKLGPARVMVNYKLGDADPVKTLDTTADWDKTPFPQPQSSLVGPMFRCAHAGGDFVVSDPTAWPFRGLGLAAGTKLPGVVGPEFDRLITAVPTPRPMQVLSHSPVQCRGDADFADMTWYTAQSGAGVFAAGTLDWIRSMSSVDPLTRRITVTVTQRVLHMMGTPRAGLVQPATDNVATYYALDGTPIAP